LPPLAKCNSAPGAALAPSLCRRQGEGWGGVAFAVAIAVAVAVALDFDLPGPFRSDGASGKNPKGDVHGCTSFFAATGMSCRKIPLAEWTRAAQRGGRVGRVCLPSHSAVEKHLFWLSFFAQAKKSNSLPEGERKLLFLLLLLLQLQLQPQPQPQPQPRLKAFARLRRASTPFFACAKKRGPKKAHPASAPTSLCDAAPLRWQDFSTIHPCIVEKRRTSVCVAPFGVLSASSVATEGAR